MSAMASKLGARWTANTVLNPCSATHGIELRFDVGYQNGGCGFWTGLSRVTTLSKVKYAPWWSMRPVDKPSLRMSSASRNIGRESSCRTPKKSTSDGDEPRLN